MNTALLKSIAASRSTGTVNVSNRGLTELPQAVYDVSVSVPGAEAKWWEVVELTKIDCSKNQLTQLPDQVGICRHAPPAVARLAA